MSWKNQEPRRILRLGVATATALTLTGAVIRDLNESAEVQAQILGTECVIRAAGSVKKIYKDVQGNIVESPAEGEPFRVTNSMMPGEKFLRTGADGIMRSDTKENQTNYVQFNGFRPTGGRNPILRIERIGSTPGVSVEGGTKAEETPCGVLDYPITKIFEVTLDYSRLPVVQLNQTPAPADLPEIPTRVLATFTRTPTFTPSPTSSPTPTPTPTLTPSATPNMTETVAPLATAAFEEGLRQGRIGTPTRGPQPVKPGGEAKPASEPTPTPEPITKKSPGAQTALANALATQAPTLTAQAILNEVKDEPPAIQTQVAKDLQAQAAKVASSERCKFPENVGGCIHDAHPLLSAIGDGFDLLGNTIHSIPLLGNAGDFISSFGVLQGIINPTLAYFFLRNNPETLLYPLNKPKTRLWNGFRWTDRKIRTHPKFVGTRFHQAPGYAGPFAA